MLKTTTVTGDRAACTIHLETFIQREVTQEKPVFNHLIMTMEHLVLALVKDIKTVTMSIDLEAGELSFKVS